MLLKILTVPRANGWTCVTIQELTGKQNAMLVDFWTRLDHRSQNPLQIRIWARKKAVNNRDGEYALNVTEQILQFYEQYYNSRYPLSKSGRWLLPSQVKIRWWKFMKIVALTNKSGALSQHDIKYYVWVTFTPGLIKDIPLPLPPLCVSCSHMTLFSRAIIALFIHSSFW